MLTFRRVVSTALLDAVAPEGPFAFLIEKARQRLDSDVQLRHDTPNAISGATYYFGLGAVLLLQEKDGAFRLKSDAAYKRRGAFNAEWGRWQPLLQLSADRAAIESHLDLVRAHEASRRQTKREGIVQAGLSKPGQARFGVVQREAEVWSKPGDLANDAKNAISGRLWRAIEDATRGDLWWPGVRDDGKQPGMGRAVDLLGISRGRLAVIEVKPTVETAKIPWAAAQVTVYAELFAEWLHTNPSATDDLAAMSEQRHAIGLLDEPWCTPLSPAAQVVPVIAIGPDPTTAAQKTQRAEVLRRLSEVANVLATAPSTAPWASRLAPLEVWLCTSGGIVHTYDALAI